MSLELLRSYREGALRKKLSALRSNLRSPGHLLDPVQESPLIYHYTTVAGLQGIVSANRLRASSAYYLNDSSEVQYGCDLLLDVMSEWREANRSMRSFAVDVLSGLIRVLSHSESRVLRAATIYMVCFCEEGNLLSQWRAYGRAGGYSLGFRVHGEDMGLRPASLFWDLRLAKVLYSRPWQYRVTRSLFTDLMLAVSDKSLGDELSSTDRQGLLVDVVRFAEDLLLDSVIAFKNPVFEEEKEWRLIARPHLDSAEVVPRPVRKGGPSDFKFRRSGGSLVPYIELLPKRERIPLVSVRYGPSLEPGRTRNSVDMLLAASGFHDIRVVGSDIPVTL
jgi:hypothetical protein